MFLRIKNSVGLLLAATFFFLCASPAQAARCGGGKIIEIKEGGWNSDDFMLLIDYSDFSNQHPGTTYGGYVRYKADSLSPARLESIRRVALTAMVSGKTVLTYSHNATCSDATEITVYAFR